MIAIGIGFHNLGEGLAVGAAIALGEVALSTFLIVGFATHNTTEGLAIAAPLTGTKAKIAKMIGLGLIAGIPAIFGTWIGGFSFSPFFTLVFLAIGAGAIFPSCIVNLSIYERKIRFIVKYLIICWNICRIACYVFNQCLNLKIL